MAFTLTPHEKEIAINNSSHYFMSCSAGKYLFKILIDYLSITNLELSKELSSLTEDTFLNEEKMQTYTRKMIGYMNLNFLEKY